jgi:hypothetical protein
MAPDQIDVKFSPSQRLPDGYRVFYDTGMALYYYEHVPTGHIDGECWDRFAVRRMAIRHSRAAHSTPGE